MEHLTSLQHLEAYYSVLRKVNQTADWHDQVKSAFIQISDDLQRYEALTQDRLKSDVNLAPTPKQL